MLHLIEDRNVVTIVGEDLLTVNAESGPTTLYPYLARRLAEYLGVPDDALPRGDELNEVACRFLSQGNTVEDIYPALRSVVSSMENLPVPEPLLQLAGIDALQLFVTTTFDGMLSKALSVRRPGAPKPLVLAHSPAEVEDLPGELDQLNGPVVYHLLGKLSATPAYAVTQEDMVEFFHSLQSETRQPRMLFDELSRRSLLILGSRFSGWLTRFFMRMSKRQRLSAGGRSDYVAGDAVTEDANLVTFLRHFSRATKVYRSGGAVEFVKELHERWTARHPEGTATAAGDDSARLPGAGRVEPGAVFLSYASEDAAAVHKIKSALQSAGVDVFLDREQLQPGENWDVRLRRSIATCSLFVPVISRETLTPERRYFRTEWNVALEEAQKVSFSAEEVFLLPVVVDDTTADNPAIPAAFRAIQWMHLPGGEATPEFVRRVQLLYRKYQKSRAANV